MQWDTSEHDWLEGRGEKLYLIAMIDDATSRLFARFVRHDTTEQNIEAAVELPGEVREASGVLHGQGQYLPDGGEAQTGRAGSRPGIMKRCRRRRLDAPCRSWELPGSRRTPAGERASGEEFRDGTGDRLVKGLRVAGVKTIEQANQYLEETYLVWWERELTVEAAHSDDAHRPLDKSHRLEASLSHVETRQVRNDYTIPLDAELYQIRRQAVVSGLRKASVRVEKRLDGSIAVRFGEQYLPVSRCASAAKTKALPAKPATPRRPPNKQRGSGWGKNFDLKKGPKIWQVT